jgi:uncharacterized OB-fold protein
MNRTYYDENFGHWNIDSEDDLEFYRQVQKESVWKKCRSCGRRVKLRPDYAICSSCADKEERGGC